jgi:hypothetical protein
VAGYAAGRLRGRVAAEVALTAAAAGTTGDELAALRRDAAALLERLRAARPAELEQDEAEAAVGVLAAGHQLGRSTRPAPPLAELEAAAERLVARAQALRRGGGGGAGAAPAGQQPVPPAGTAVATTEPG